MNVYLSWVKANLASKVKKFDCLNLFLTNGLILFTWLFTKALLSTLTQFTQTTSRFMLLEKLISAYYQIYPCQAPKANKKLFVDLTI